MIEGLTHRVRYAYRDITCRLSTKNQQDFLTRLPTELIIHIFKFLSFPDIQQMELVSRHHYSLANDRLLWKHLVEKSFSEESRNSVIRSEGYVTNYKMLFRNLYYSNFQLFKQLLLNRKMFRGQERIHFGIIESATANAFGKDIILFMKGLNREAFLPSKWIKPLPISDENILTEIALIFAERAGGRLSLGIQNYDIHNQNLLVKIAKSAAQSEGLGTARAYLNYGITNELSSLEIAEICLIRSRGEALEFIENFGIKSQPSIDRLVKIALVFSARILGQHFKKLKITDPCVRFDHAMKAVNRGKGDCAEFVEEFELATEQERYCFFKQALILSKGLAIQHVHLANIKDQQLLYDLAILSLDLNVWKFCEFFDRLNLNISYHFRLAFAAALKDGWAISLNFPKFLVEGEDKRALIAYIASENEGAGVSLNINKYRIENKERLFKIAKNSLKDNPSGFCQCVEKYENLDLGQRIQLAKEAAALNPISLTRYILHFGIVDEDALYEIGKIALLTDVKKVFVYVRCFGEKASDRLIHEFKDHPLLTPSHGSRQVLRVVAVVGENIHKRELI